jgi:group I intron endonuclease
MSEQLKAKNNNMYILYRHIFPNDKVYIGITKQKPEKRWGCNGRGYIGCPAMYNAIKKYGWENVKHQILFSKLTKEEAEKKEIEMIAIHKSTDERFGYNLDNGGNCYGTHSELTKKKISEGNKGKKTTAESRMKMSAAHKGKKLGTDNPFFGKKHTAETKQKHSKFMTGNTYFKGHHHSEDFKKRKSEQMKKLYANGNSRSKRIACFDESQNIIEEYRSLSEAARKNNISKSCICINLKKNKPIMGKIWRYVDE